MCKAGFVCGEVPHTVAAPIDMMEKRCCVRLVLYHLSYRQVALPDGTRTRNLSIRFEVTQQSQPSLLCEIFVYVHRFRIP